MQIAAGWVHWPVTSENAIEELAVIDVDPSPVATYPDQLELTSAAEVSRAPAWTRVEAPARS